MLYNILITKKRLSPDNLFFVISATGLLARHPGNILANFF